MTAPGGGRTGRRKSGDRLAVRVKAKGRSVSSARWLERQLNDPYVRAAQSKGYRSRAAFKLIDLDDRYRFLKPKRVVVDLGAAPGGWTQIAVERVKSADPGAKSRVIAVDLSEMTPMGGATVLRLDVETAGPEIRAAAGGPVDVVMSDMAPPAIGHPGTDHLRIMVLAEAALAFAREVLKPGGDFVVKLLRGAEEQAFVADLKKSFAEVRYAKPSASRSESAEVYVVAKGFRPVRA